MTTTEVIQILTTHNAWRRGAEVEPEDMPTPKQIGEAIDEAIKILKSKEIDDLIDSCIVTNVRRLYEKQNISNSKTV